MGAIEPYGKIFEISCKEHIQQEMLNSELLFFAIYQFFQKMDIPISLKVTEMTCEDTSKILPKCGVEEDV